MEEGGRKGLVGRKLGECVPPVSSWASSPLGDWGETAEHATELPQVVGGGLAGCFGLLSTVTYHG